jgi:putative hydrolase of the HAD superfamily
LYVLDIDDTLYLERDYVRSGFAAVGRWLAQNCQVHGFSDRAWELFAAGVRGNVFDRALRELHLYDGSLVKRLVRIYRQHEPDIALAPDAAAFLERHPPGDLAVITDGPSNSQWAKIRALGIEGVVGRIVVTEDWGKEFAKPHPRAYLRVQGERPPEQCVFIGDNPVKDFDAPGRLGWAPSIRVRRPRSLHYKVATPHICREVPSLDAEHCRWSGP